MPLLQLHRVSHWQTADCHFNNNQVSCLFRPSTFILARLGGNENNWQLFEYCRILTDLLSLQVSESEKVVGY